MTVDAQSKCAERAATLKTAVILAAGMGTRMKSGLPKPLHPILGEPMISYIISAVRVAGIDRVIVVLGAGGDRVEAFLGDSVESVYQEEQLGTGHALMMAIPKLEALIEDSAECLVVNGDTPLLTGDTLASLLNIRRETGSAAAVLTAVVDDPYGYGRIIKEDGCVKAIVEERDASPEQRLIKEFNVGAYSFDVGWLIKALKCLTPANAQGEYYLTDTVAWLAEQGQGVCAWQTSCVDEAHGVNDRLQLSKAQDLIRHRILKKHMLAGVTIEEPSATLIGPLTEIGADTVIETGCQIFGRTVIGSACVIGPRSKITDCRVGDGSTVDQSTLFECELGNKSTIGPYTYMRPGCVLEDSVKVGAYVEMKKVKVGEGAKVPHLSYMGDSFVGARSNIGAGTITCNYDGVDKFETIIEDDVFIGSNSNLVAPVVIGSGAYTAAGSTITKDVPPGALGIARERQTNIEGWVDRKGKTRHHVK